jgi:alpha-glucosidase
VTYRGIAIKAPKVVADEAVREARRRLQMMLHAVPNISANLKSHGAELHIIGKNQVTSHLLEYRHWHGKPFDRELDIDERTRGLGGIQASCGEENLLRLKQDRYLGRDICVHELAHTIHLYGLDDRLRRMIDMIVRHSNCWMIYSTAALTSRKFISKSCGSAA